MMRALILFLLVTVFINSVSFGYSDFYQKNKRGWFWFEEKAKIKEEKEKSSPSSSSASQSQKTAVEELKDFQEALEEKKAAMIMRPSIKSTQEFIKYQNEMFSKASTVSQNMREVMLISPELNIAKDIPVSSEGEKIRKRAEKKEKAYLLKEFAKHFRLLFFYKGENCAFCKNFAPVVETFAKRYGYKVASVTLDGKSLKGFPARYDRELIERFGVNYAPAVFIYSEELKIASPVVSGYRAIDEVEESVFYVIRKLSKRDQLRGIVK